MIDVILLIIACICFGLAATNIKSPVNLGWLGLLFFAIRGLIP